MSRCRVVAPDVVRLPLSDGDVVDVKKTLNAGEYRQLIYSQFKDTADGEKLVPDHSKVGMAKLLAYIVGWSLVGFEGQPLPYRPDEPEEIRRATIDSLDQETYRELIAAVTAHEERDAAEAAAQKKKPYYRAAIVNDLLIAQRFHWKYEWVAELPRDVYEILVAELKAEDGDYRPV